MLRFTPAFLTGLAGLALAACDANDPTGPAEPAGQSTDPSAEVGQAESVSLSLTRTPRSFYINPVSGNDNNAGTKLKPFKTLAHGLSLAISGDSMRLAAGVYSPGTNGEKFSDVGKEVPVPAGVTILGTLAEDFTSQLHGGTGQIGLRLKGGATVRNLVLSGFDKAVRADQGTQSFKNVVFDQNVLGLELSGSAKATLAGATIILNRPTGIAFGAVLTQQAQFIMDAGIITPGGENCQTGYIGVDVRDASRATLRNAVTLRNIAGTAVRLSQTSKGLLKGATTIDRDFLEAPGCIPLPSIRTSDAASLTLNNARLFDGNGVNSVGVEAKSSAPLTITAGFNSYSGAALRLFTGAKVVISGSTFSSNILGIDATPVGSPNLTITNSSLLNNITGIIAGSAIVRNSQLVGNQVAIVVDNAQVDLGRSDGLGNNTITGSAQTSVKFSQKAISAGGGTVFASGNTWKASTQGADAAGLYPANSVLSGLSPNASGQNFQLPAGKNFLILF
jgi:hypothetical protein